MYSNLPNAVAELVANAYDADATEVRIVLDAEGSIAVRDDGHGMSRDEVATKYLHIGRNRRQADSTSMTESRTRRVSGKKGLGKLALFGIGKTVEMSTTRAGSGTSTAITLSYDAMMAAEGAYQPKESSLEAAPEAHGTWITLRELKRKSDIDAAALAASLSRLFNYADSTFAVYVEDSSGVVHKVTRESRIGAVEQESQWDFPKDFVAEDELLRDKEVSGHIVSLDIS